MTTSDNLLHDCALSEEEFRQLPEEIQVRVMERWFRSRYEDPVVQTPRDGEDGWVWVAGGPFDARDELETEFGDSVSPEVIDRLAQNLELDCVEWAPVETEDRFILEPDNARLFEAASSTTGSGL